VEEVELGGLEDEGDNLVLGPADDEYRLFDRDEVRIVFFFVAPVIHLTLILNLTLLLKSFFLIHDCWM
jgi:hypothetical protein